jgi:hypothetical protein
MAIKTRDQLKQSFSPNSIPTSQDFNDLIDSQYNMIENSLTKGATGPKGDQGAPGMDGARGESGIDGVSGTSGLSGSSGISGSSGSSGVDGTSGSSGKDGAPGVNGNQGIQGIPGIQGPKGDKGDSGDRGPQGYIGPVGPVGPAGKIGPQGLSGFSNWTVVTNGGISTGPTSSTFVKTGNGQDWDSQLISLEGYSRGCYCSAQPTDTTQVVCFGLSSNSSNDNGYDSIDYGWYLDSEGNSFIYESGNQISSCGSYSSGDIFYINFDGINVRYYKNSNLLRTHSIFQTGQLHFKSSFYYPNSQGIKNVCFGPQGMAAVTPDLMSILFPYIQQIQDLQSRVFALENK